jgi:hypothetical protein
MLDATESVAKYTITAMIQGTKRSDPSSPRGKSKCCLNIYLLPVMPKVP